MRARAAMGGQLHPRNSRLKGARLGVVLKKPQPAIVGGGRNAAEGEGKPQGGGGAAVDTSQTAMSLSQLHPG
jgi:hypothetical protein